MAFFTATTVVPSLFAGMLLIVLLFPTGVPRVSSAPVTCEPHTQIMEEPKEADKDTSITLDSPLCPWNVTVDYNPERIPKSLRNIRCATAGKADCNCAKNRMCTEVSQKITVRYPSLNREEEYTLHIGCVCSTVDSYQLKIEKPEIL